LNPFNTASPLNIDNPANPFNPNNPLNPSSPNNPLEPLLGPIIDNVTDSINNGLENTLNDIVEGLVNAAGLRDVYNLYIDTICSGDITNGESIITECASYEAKNAGTYPSPAILSFTINRYPAT
jgi:hypothetical protein